MGIKDLSDGAGCLAKAEASATRYVANINLTNSGGVARFCRAVSVNERHEFSNHLDV
jgi:hypothetical protein